MERRPILQEQVDFLLDCKKSMAGYPLWQNTDYANQKRWLSPLAVNGEVTKLNLIVDAYPNHPVFKFTILLTYGRCISRLDYSEIERHNNHKVAGFPTPAGITMGFISGPHLHGWQDNRVLCNNNTLPDRLEWARVMPRNVQGFENAFRWFCGENNILCGVNQIPELPTRDILL